MARRRILSLIRIFQRGISKDGLLIGMVPLIILPMMLIKRQAWRGPPWPRAIGMMLTTPSKESVCPVRARASISIVARKSYSGSC